MGNFNATRPHVYVTGAIILALNHNENEVEIYTEHNASIHETTGHGHSGSTGDGPKLTSAGLNLTGSFAWSGQHSFSGAATGTSITSTSVNAASIVIQNTNSTVNNFQSIDFKNSTGAVVGRIGLTNVDHTAATEDTSFRFVTIAAGALVENALLSDTNGFILYHNDSTTTLSTSWKNRVCLQNTNSTVDAGSAIETLNSSGVLMSKIAFTNVDNTGASEDSRVTISLRTAGSFVNNLILSGTSGLALTFSESSTTTTAAWKSRIAITNSDSTTNAGGAFEFYNSSGVLMSKIASINVDNTGASEDSKFSFLTRLAGTLSEVMTIEGDGFRFNPAGTQRIGIDGSAATSSLLTFPNCQQTTGNVISVNAADSLTTGSILNLVSDSADVNTRSLVRIKNDNAAATGTSTLELLNDSTGANLLVTDTGANVALGAITVSGNANANIGLLLTSTGSGTSPSLSIIRTGDNISARSAFSIRHTNGGAGASYGIDMNDSNIDRFISFPTDNTDPTGGGGAAVGRVPVDINGTLRYFAYY